MHMLLKAAAAIAVTASPAAAERYDFNVTKDTPVRFTLLSDGGQNNRVFHFDAQLLSDFASSLNVKLLTNDRYCAENIYCGGTYPGGVITDTATFATGPDAVRAFYSTSLPGNNPGEANDVFITFSTLGDEVIQVRDFEIRFGNLVPEVPEPSTWALMLAGFALTGYALRRRRVAFA